MNIILLCSIQLCGQTKLPDNVLKDLTVQSTKQVLEFFDRLELLGRGELKEETRRKSINSTTTLFTPNGTVEERSKLSKVGKTRPVKKYLETIKKRGEQRKTLISYNIIDNLTSNELIPVVNNDGSTSYKGSITVRQFYCTLSQENMSSDLLSQNCKYSDTTDKKIYIEIKLLKDSQRNLSFAVLIDKIVVLSVS